MSKETEVGGGGWGGWGGYGNRREVLRETAADGGGGGWQALLSADSDMAVGDR